MKRKVNTILLMIALFVAPLVVSAEGQKTETVDKVKTRAAEALTKGKEVVVKLRPGTKILVGKKDLPFEFIRSASLSGRIKELRDKDFTFSDSSDRMGDVTTVISYTDVVSIKRPSGFEKALKSVGRYSLGVVAIPVVLPLYGLLALIGELPAC